ncbi:hypothetical protein E2562_030528 [Oryza meyeriana var. granulata]|uniref:Uncharacterized protein n=1 Tax=Oryza meyeriana var. granulata TaxID=110450 RepID=A0A6G1BPP6_9ORYZ|nr:hypothetical protein E2562_030528 [Oryza meyeriana var. granulata]
MELMVSFLEELMEPLRKGTPPLEDLWQLYMMCSGGVIMLSRPPCRQRRRHKEHTCLAASIPTVR